MEELKQIETMSLKDFINQEMTRLHREGEEILGMSTESFIENMHEFASKTAQLIILQEIAYRLEYGFITEIGDTNLKKYLAKP